MNERHPPQDESRRRQESDPAEQGKHGDQDHPPIEPREKRLRTEDDDGDELVGSSR